MPQYVTGDTRTEPRKPKKPAKPSAPAPVDVTLTTGEKRHQAALQGRYDETQAIARQHAAQDIAKRAALFPSGTVAQHPVITASLIKSSISTDKLRTVAANLERAWQFVQARNAMTIAQHDPDYTNPELAQAAATNAMYLRLKDDPEMLRQAVEAGAEGLLGPDESLISELRHGFEGGFQIIGAPFKAAGWTLDRLGLDEVRDVADIGLHGLQQGAMTAGRAVSGAAAAALGVYGTLRGHGEDVDWDTVKYFWDLNRDDPLTTQIFSLSGWDINDPKNKEARDNLNFLAGMADQIALGKVLGRTGELLRTPREYGGFFKAETFVKFRILNRGIFSSIGKMFEKVSPESRTGQLLATARGIDVKLADVLAKAFDKGTDLKTSIAHMKDEYVNYVKDKPSELIGRLKEVNKSLAENPSDPMLVAERISLRTRLENLTGRQYQATWPRYTELRGALKGVPAETALGRAFNGIYSRKFQGAFNVMKFVDNVRDRFTSWSPWDPKRPGDWMEQNARNWGRLMRAGRVPAETIAARLGEMPRWIEPGATRGMYGEWVKRVTNDIVDSAKFLDQASKDRILSTLRNDEIYAERAVVPELVAGEDGAVRIADKRVLEGPTQENEFAASSHAPSASDVKNMNSAMRDVERRWGGSSWEKFEKLRDNGMAGWRAATIAPRGAAINLAIQSSEVLVSFFEGTGLRLGTRAAQRIGAKLIGHVPISEAAAEAVAQRLGFVNEAAARAWYDQVKMQPEQLGQMVWDMGAESAKRMRVPADQFNKRFLEGAFESGDPLVSRHFRDLAWEVEHIADSRMVRTVVSRGVDATADLMLGEKTPVPAVIKGTGTVKVGVDEPIGTARYIYTTKEAYNGILESGAVEPRVAPLRPGEEPAVWAFDDPYKYSPTGESRTVLLRVDPDAPVTWRGAADELSTTEAIPTQFVKVYTGPNEWAPLRKVAGESLDLQETYASLADRITTEYGPGRDGLVRFLGMKERQAQVLAGGAPEVLDLLGKGRTSGVRLPNEMEVDLLNEELGQLRLNLLDPETPMGQRLSLIDRKAALMERLGAEDAGHYVGATDTAEVARLLRERAQSGEYQLPSHRWTEVTRKGWMDEEGAWQGAQSKFLRATYGAMKWMNKDIARQGFFKASYVKFYERLRKAGWTEAAADEAAASRAAFEVRDWMHDIGNKSSFQRALRNEFPFLHAWERVAYQWFVKLPTRMGAGFTPLGWAIESNIAHEFEGLMRSVGVVRREQGVDGEMHDVVYLPNPLHLINWIPGIGIEAGGNIEFKGPDTVQIDDPGHLFIPARLVQGELPGLAPQAAFLLNESAKAFGGPFKRISHELTMDGAFGYQTSGQRLATRVWEAVVGDVPPWEIGSSRKYQEYVMARAHDSAWRYAYADLAEQGQFPPNPADFEGDRAGYLKARDAYWGELRTTADEYFHGINMTYLLSKAASPVSFRPTTSEELAWKRFLKENGIDGPRTQEDYDLIEKYLGDHPESLAFNVSMYDRASEWPTEDGYAAFQKAVVDGDVRVLNSKEYRTTLALHQEWDYVHEAQRRALQAAGLGDWYSMSAEEQLLHWGEYVAVTAPVWDNFDRFLEDNDKARILYEKYQTPSAKAYDRIQEIERDRYDIIRAGGDPDLMEQRVYDNLAVGTEYGTTSTEHALWYRNTIMHDYYDATSALYDRIDELEASKAPGAAAAQSRIYDRLRDLNNQYPEIIGPDGTVFPSPEEFAYAKKTPQEQKESREHWASLPPAWLTNYQYATTYGEPEGHVKAYFNQEAQVQNYFDAHTANLSTSSREYDSWVKWRETSLDTLARNNDAWAVRRLEKAPDIVRLQAAGLTPDSMSMNWIVDQSASIAQRLRSSGLSVWGASQDAQYYRGWLESYITKMRDPNSQYYDPAVDHFFTLQARKTGITFEPALYRFVLFGIEGGFEIQYDFSAENRLARSAK